MNLPDALLDRALHAIADPTRRRILQALRHTEADTKTERVGAASGCLCAGDIEARVQLSQPTISHHMAGFGQGGVGGAYQKGGGGWDRGNEKAGRKGGEVTLR